MYAAVSMQVRIDGNVGELFMAETGVKQGDPLSPLLFGLYIDRLENYLLSNCEEGVDVSDTVQLQSLLYADDLTLLAHDSKHLQDMLNTLHTFCQACHLTVNVNKSVVVVFNRRGQSLHFSYAGGVLPVQPSFTYLGVAFSNRGSIADVASSSSQKARAALHGMMGRCRALGVYNVMIQCNLFQTLVASVLNYACPTWSVYHMHSMGRQGWGASSTVEEIQRCFLRMAMQVPKSTTVAVLMNEARRLPLQHAWLKQTVTWYNKIVARAVDDLVKCALVGSMQMVDDDVGCASCWGTAFLTSIRAVIPDLDQLVRGTQALPLSRLLDALTQKWYEHIWGDWAHWVANAISPRMYQPSNGFKQVTYRSWFCHGTLHETEPARCPAYARHGFAYHLNKPEHVRAVAAFRMRANALNIEQHNIPRGQRLCQCCRDANGNHHCVEDEMHIFECPAYMQLRHQFADVLSATCDPMTDDAMYAVMNPTEPAQWRRLANFLLKVFELRSSIISND